MYSNFRFSGNGLMKIKKVITFLYASFFLAMLNGCSEGDPTALFESLIVEFNDVQSISVSAQNSVITTGDDLQLTVTGTNSQAGTVDLTEYVSWTVSNDNLARVKSGGLLESFSIDGTVTVTASLSNFSDTIDITLSSAALSSIDIEPASAVSLTTSVCRPIALKAMGTYDDATIRDITDKVSWSTTTPSAILKTTPEVTLSYYNTPSANVSAELDSINSGAIDVTVNDDITSMVLTPATVTLATGSTQVFEVLAVYGAETDVNISTTVDWDSSDTAKAAFNSNDEVLTGILQGSTTVTATCGSQIETAQVTVEGKTLVRIEISPDITSGLLTMTTNSSFQLTASAFYLEGSTETEEDITDQVSWSATHPNTTVVVTVDDVDPNKGLVTSTTNTGIDFVQIDYSGLSDQLTVEVTP